MLLTRLKIPLLATVPMTLCAMVQNEFPAETSPITSVEADAPPSRLPLDHVSWIEVDKITTVRGHRIEPSSG